MKKINDSETTVISGGCYCWCHGDTQRGQLMPNWNDPWWYAGIAEDGRDCGRMCYKRTTASKCTDTKGL